ncbi:MAG: hypothetical protein ACOY32_00240 [Thermodesulfobacteriota bacterium]
MRKNIRSLSCIALLGLAVTPLFASAALAEEDKPTADLSVAALTKYVWRGFEFSKDSIVLQPSMTVGYKGFGFNLWGNLDTDEHEFLGGVDEGSSSWNETDMTLSWGNSCSFADYGVGYIYYAVDGAQDTQEVYASATLKTLLSPSLTIYRDYDAAPGWYLSLGISHSFAITEQLALDLGAKVGYYDIDDEDTMADPNDPSDAYSAFHDGVVSASMTFPVTDYLSVTPMLSYSFPLTSDAEDVIEAGSANGKDSDFVYGGVTLSMSF